MLIDLITLGLLSLFFLKGFQRGAIMAVLMNIAMLIGIIGATKLAPVFTEWGQNAFPNFARWIPLLAYITIFTLIILLFRRIAALFQSSLKTIRLGFLNHLLGGCLYALIVLLLLSILFWVIEKMQFNHFNALASSKSYQFLNPFGETIIQFLASLLPFLKNAISYLNDFFDSFKSGQGI